MAKGRCSHQGRIGNAHTVVQFVLFLNAAQDRYRILHRGFIHHHRLEPPCKGCILFNILAVFIQRGRAHTVQIAPRQSGFDQVSGIHSPIRFASADQSVHFVDEQDDVAFSAGHFVEHGFQTLFKLTPIFRSSDKRAHIQRHQLFIAQRFRHIAVHDAQRQAFGDGGLAHTGFADQHGVVLGAARQNLHGAANFFVTPNDRVNLTFSGGFGQVASVFLKRVITLFRTRRIRRAAFANFVDRGVQLLRCNSARLQSLFGFGGDQGHSHQNAFHGNKAVARLFGDLLGLIQDTRQGWVHKGLRIACNFGQFGHSQRQSLAHPCGLAPRTADQVG